MCRRKYQVEYLGEPFDDKNCNSTCDICMESKSKKKNSEIKNVINQFNLIKQSLMESKDLTFLKLITLLSTKPKDNKENKF